MGRRRKKKKQGKSNPYMTEEEKAEAMESLHLIRHEEALLMVCQEDKLVVPWQFKNWKRFFLNKSNYLDAFQGWLSAQSVRRGHVRIIDDVDKGLMKLGPDPGANETRSQFSGNAWTGWGYGSEDGDYGHGQGRYSSSLPLTPTIDAPVGTCGEEHFVI